MNIKLWCGIGPQMRLIMILLASIYQGHSTEDSHLLENCLDHSLKKSHTLQKTFHENDMSPIEQLDIKISVKSEEKNRTFFSLHSCGMDTVLETLYGLFSGCFQTNTHGGYNFINLPKNSVLYLSGFLDSESILKLSGVNQRIRKIFTDDFWINYLSKLPIAHSYLILNGPLSPSSQRKAFFSHLWYREGRIDLAARLNHPEAKIAHQYNIYLDKSQYVCPLEYIRSTSGEVNTIKTKELEKAKEWEAKRQIEKNIESKRLIDCYTRRFFSFQNIQGRVEWRF